MHKVIYNYRLMLDEDTNSFYMASSDPNSEDKTYSPMTMHQVVWLRNALCWFLPDDDPEHKQYRCEVLDHFTVPSSRNVVFFKDAATRNKFVTVVNAQFPMLEALSGTLPHSTE